MFHLLERRRSGKRNEIFIQNIKAFHLKMKNCEEIDKRNPLNTLQASVKTTEVSDCIQRLNKI